MNNDWREEFDEFVEEYHITTNVDPYHLPDDKTKAFIQSILDQKAKEIERLKVDKYDDESVAFNESLDQALTILKGEKV